MLSDHICFGQYLHWFKKLDNPRYVDCNAQFDDAENVLFLCDKWWMKRLNLEGQIGTDLPPDTVVALILRPKDNWKAVKNFVKDVMPTKEEEERERQNHKIIIL